jgi:hypothetical protein
VKKERADASLPLVALVRREAIREVVAVFPDAFSVEKRIPEPIPDAAVPDVDLPRESMSNIELVELSERDAERAGTPDKEEVVETLKDPAPWERKPPLPTVILVLAIIEPFACISLSMVKLPERRDAKVPVVDSRPPRSRMDMVLAPVFVIYA